jgi:pimeloyl-ACP methyl ester carboxylesterase
LSGHGNSEDIDTEAGPATLAAYAEDVEAIAAETDADILVGNSLGGAVVFEVVLSGTDDPAGVVFAGSGAKLAVHEDLRRLLEDDFEGAIERLHEPGMLLGEADEQTLDQSKETLRSAGQAVTRRDFLTCHQFDVREELSEIAVPALAVVGEDDQLTPPVYHEYLAAHIGSCRFETIPDAGHLAMLERPTAFNDTLASFVADIPKS